ncbi:unnamed protein product [Musa acuminata var. zebrina]
MVAAYGAMKPTELGLEEPQEQLHRIRITLSSRLQERHESREGMCGSVEVSEGQAADGQGCPPRYSTSLLLVLPFSCRRLHIGQSSVYPRVIDLASSSELVKQIASITIEPGLDVEVTIAEP